MWRGVKHLLRSCAGFGVDSARMLLKPLVTFTFSPKLREVQNKINAT